MSIAANLRNAFRESSILQQPNNRVQVLIDAPTMLIPMDEFEEEDVETLFRHTFPDHSNEAVMWAVMPDLNSIAVFSINKDLRTVINDHYTDVRITPLIIPVWQHLHKRSYSGTARKLYAYFHDRQLSVFAYSKNRFRFANTFSATEQADMVFYILYVWKQLGMDQKKDELYFVGNVADHDALRAELKKYLMNAFRINPTAEFNRAPITQVPQVTYDLMCHLTI